ncbi:MAG: radical SAM protein [Deltaproteobacteria bacterium]|nr:radical SAM protein [Deltaproteobacteria bacterium]
MDRPQRHRLLHGYPMAPLLRRAAHKGARRLADGALELGKDGAGAPEPAWITLDHTRPLLVGILPHAQCTPTVEGCGFCTFPHGGRYDQLLSRGQQMLARHDVEQLAQLPRRQVAAVYFGGGTANLVREEALRDLFDRLTRHHDVAHAEVTLEGVPALFLTTFSDRLGWLADLPAAHKRISMGIQTFAPDWLERMGRRAFGDAGTFARVVKRARRRGLTVSGDLLFDLPGQTLEDMREDVRRAVELGLDQVCVYHLVLYAGLGTPWSKDPALVAAMPDNEAACQHWLQLRDDLLAAGYVQTTLTNFERCEAHDGPRRFVYEEHSFTPERYDAVGCGLHGISTFLDVGGRRAVKLVRGAPQYLNRWALEPPWTEHDYVFLYDEEDTLLLHVTRSLARARLDLCVVRERFGLDAAERFAGELAACAEAGLVVLNDRELSLTPRGMFFADAVVGLLAAGRAAVVRQHAAGQHTLGLIERRAMYDGMG